MTTCPNGHNMDGDSDWYQARGSMRRRCSECRRQQQNEIYQRRRRERMAAWNERLEQLVDAYGIAATAQKYATREALLAYVRAYVRGSA